MWWGIQKAVSSNANISSAVYSSCNIFKHLLSLAIRNHSVCTVFDSRHTDIYVKLSIKSVNAARFFRQRGTENFCICSVVSYVTEVSAEVDASFFSYWYQLFQLNSVGAVPYCRWGRKRDKFLKVLILFGRSDDGQTPQNSYRSLGNSCTDRGLQINPATG